MAPFCSCPASLVSRIFFAVGPGCAKRFFCCAPLGAATFRRGQRSPVPARGQSKKKTNKHHLGCFFLLRPRRKAREGEAPLGAGTGPEQKKSTIQVFFFCSGPGERQGKEKPRWAGPCRHGASPSPAFPRGRSKKNTLGGVFFFCCGPARTLTHSLRAWVAMPPPRRGGVFLFFLLWPRPDWGGAFFWLWPRPDAHSFRQGPVGVFFFLLRPRRVFLDNNKKCLGYYIGSKTTRRGHSKKKTPLPIGTCAVRLNT